MLARHKHSSLLRTFVNYGRKKFYNIGPRSCIEILNLNYFHEWICQSVRMCDPPKGGRDTCFGGLAPVRKIAGSLFKTHTRKMLVRKNGLSKAPVSCITWSIFKMHKWHTQFWNPVVNVIKLFLT